MTAGRDPANVLFLKDPAGLNGVEVRGVGWLVNHTYASCSAGGNDAGIVVGVQVVHHQDVVPLQFRQQLLREPCDEAVRVRGLEDRIQGYSAEVTERTEKRQVLAAIHRDTIDVLLASLHPGV